MVVHWSGFTSGECSLALADQLIPRPLSFDKGGFPLLRVGVK